MARGGIQRHATLTWINRERLWLVAQSPPHNFVTLPDVTESLLATQEQKKKPSVDTVTLLVTSGPPRIF